MTRRFWQLDGVLDALAEAVTVHGEDEQIVYANTAAAALLGRSSAEELLNAPPGELLDEFVITREDGTPVTAADLPGARVLAGEASPELLTRSVHRHNGRSYWLLTKATRLESEDGLPLAVNIIADVTAAKEAELRQRFLAEAGQLLASSLDYELTLQRVARLAVPTLADWCGVDIATDEGSVQVAVAHADQAKVGLARELRQRYPPDYAREDGLGAVLRTGRPQLYPDIPGEMIVAAAHDAEHLRLIRDVGMRAAMIVPMRVGDDTVGAITFVTAESGRTFDEQDLAFAQDLALRAATAVQNARLFAAQSRVAHTLQDSLLPEALPRMPGWTAAASYRAGERGTDVGGDFYDVVATERGPLVVLGDVTGKGVAAAALTALVRHTARTAARFDARPGAVMAILNEVLVEQPRLSLVTVVCALLEEHDGGIRMTTAVGGHPLPLLKRGSTVAPVGRTGRLLGVEGEAAWDEHVVDVLPGDTLLFFTDGVIDTPGERQRFGERRLHEVLVDAPADPLALL
jgi:PAS domain S-box-containing protein